MTGSEPPAPARTVLGRLLTHPRATEQRWLHQLNTYLGGWEPHALPLLLAGAAVLAAAAPCWLLLALRPARPPRGGRWVRIIPPTQPDPRGALDWWQLVSRLLTSPRLVGGRPPVAWELVASEGQLTAGLWVSRSMPAEAICRQAAVAWPGARAEVTGAPALLPAGRALGRSVRPAGAHYLPLATSDGVADPMRAVLTALCDCRAGECAVLQVLARPARRRLSRARRQARALQTGRAASPLGHLLDAAVGRQPPARRPATAGIDPQRAADLRAAAGKLAGGPHFEVAVRYAVSTHTAQPGTRGRAEGRAAGRRRVSRCREIAAGFGLFGGIRLLPRQVRRPGRLLAGRRMRGAFLASAAELAGLAHLPADPAQLGMSAGAAHRVAPPPQVPRA